MNTRKTKPNGFIMLFVVVILALIGTYMIILTSDANIFGFQADRAYLEACQQNLTASGLNWAKKNVGALKPMTSPVGLDASDMGIKNAVLRVKFAAGEKGKYQVEINTSCSKARQRLSSVKKFTVETRP
jgi:hypothetical protein